MNILTSAGNHLMKTGKNLPKGNYIIQIEADNSIITTQKIIKK
jgi:hypothetical protein